MTSRSSSLWSLALGATLVAGACSSKQGGPEAGRTGGASGQSAAAPTSPPGTSNPGRWPRPAKRPDFKDQAELTAIELPDLPRDSEAIVLFPDGTMAAACGEDGKVQTYRVPSKEPVATFDGYPGTPRLAISADRRLLAQGSDQRTEIKVWDAEKQQERKTLAGHKFPISDIAFSSAGARLASSSRSQDSSTEGEIRIWNLAEDSEPLVLDPQCGVSAVAWSGDGSLLATAGVAQSAEKKMFGEVTVWDLEKRQVKTKWTSKVGPAYQVTFSPDGKTIAFSELNGPRPTQLAYRIRLADPQTGDEQGILLGHIGRITGLAFSSDGAFLASAGQDGLLQVWQTATWSRRSVRALGRVGAGKLTFAAGANQLAVAIAGRTENVHPTVWELSAALQSEPQSPTGEPFSIEVLKRPSPDGIRALQVSSDGRSVAAHSDSAGLRICDSPDWKARTVNSAPGHFALAFSGDLQHAAVCAQTLELWDLAGSGRLHDFRDETTIPTTLGPAPAIHDAAFSLDGKFIVSTHWPRAVKIRRVPTGEWHALAMHPEGHPVRVALSADATKLATAVDPGFVDDSPDCRGPVCIWDMKQPDNPSQWRRESTREMIRRNDSQRPKPVFAKAGNRFRERRQAEAVSELQLAAGELAEIGVGSDPQPFQWHEVNMNLTKDRVDAVRFKLPEGGPMDLLWTVVFPPNLNDCQITPVAGDLPDAQVRYISVYPDQQTGEITVARVLEGPSLKPGQEFLMWLSFRNENAAKVSMSLTAFPAGRIREQGRSWVPTGTPELEGVPVLRRTRLLFHGDPVIGIALSPDGRALASAGTDKIVKLWDVEAAKVMATCSGYMPTFSPDGKVLATAGNGEDSVNITLWDVKTAQKIRTLAGGHFLAVTSISFSADGKRLASGGRDGWITLWDPETGKQAW